MCIPARPDCIHSCLRCNSPDELHISVVLGTATARNFNKLVGHVNVLGVALDVDVSSHCNKADRFVASKRCEGPFADAADELDGSDTIVGYKDAVDGRAASDALHKAVYLLAETRDPFRDSCQTNFPACQPRELCHLPFHTPMRCCGMVLCRVLATGGLFVCQNMRRIQCSYSKSCSYGKETQKQV